MTHEHDLVAYECLYYTPSVDYKVTQITDEIEKIIDVDEPRVLYDNDEHFPLSYGKSYRVDVRSTETVVEFGQTWPFNLLTPLLDGLADKAIWIPYPPRVEPSTFELSASGLSDVGAYTISFISHSGEDAAA